MCLYLPAQDLFWDVFPLPIYSALFLFTFHLLYLIALPHKCTVLDFFPCLISPRLTHMYSPGLQFRFLPAKQDCSIHEAISGTGGGMACGPRFQWICESVHRSDSSVVLAQGSECIRVFFLKRESALIKFSAGHQSQHRFFCTLYFTCVTVRYSYAKTVI